MSAEQLDVINMRLDFQSMVLAVLARSLPPREAAHAVQVILSYLKTTRRDE